MYAFPHFQHNFCLALGLVVRSLRSPQSRLTGKSRQKVAGLYAVKTWGGGVEVKFHSAVSDSLPRNVQKGSWDSHSLLISAYRRLFPP